jgi:hypothetical protein
MLTTICYSSVRLWCRFNVKAWHNTYSAMKSKEGPTFLEMSWCYRNLSTLRVYIGTIFILTRKITKSGICLARFRVQPFSCVRCFCKYCSTTSKFPPKALNTRPRSSDSSRRSSSTSSTSSSHRSSYDSFQVSKDIAAEPKSSCLSSKRVSCCKS